MQLTLQLHPQETARARNGDGGRSRTVFVRHRWARRYILRMLDDGSLRVTLPRWGSKREAQAFLERSEPWIAQQRLKHQARPAVVHPDEPALRRRAATELPPELLALAAAHGVTVTRISIRNQRSRWGACSSRRIDHAQLAAGAGSAAGARVRHDS